MDNFNIDTPEFNGELRKLKTTDKAHADLFNELFESLLNNDIYLNRLADTMVKKSSMIHDTETNDPDKVAAADVTADLQNQLNEEKGKSLFYDNVFDGEYIDAGTDLNTLDFGCYLSESGTTSATLINSPYKNGGFRLTVKRICGETNSNLYRKQVLEPNSGVFNNMERNLLNGTWTEWREMAFNNTVTGTASVPLTAKQVTERVVNFSVPYTTAPKILLTAQTATPNKIFVSVKTITTASFTIAAYSEELTGNVTVNWIAV